MFAYTKAIYSSRYGTLRCPGVPLSCLSRRLSALVAVHGPCRGASPPCVSTGNHVLSDVLRLSYQHMLTTRSPSKHSPASTRQRCPPRVNTACSAYWSSFFPCWPMPVPHHHRHIHSRHSCHKAPHKLTCHRRPSQLPCKHDPFCAPTLAFLLVLSGVVLSLRRHAGSAGLRIPCFTAAL